MKPTAYHLVTNQGYYRIRVSGVECNGELISRFLTNLEAGNQLPGNYTSLLQGAAEALCAKLNKSLELDNPDLVWETVPVGKQDDFQWRPYGRDPQNNGIVNPDWLPPKGWKDDQTQTLHAKIVMQEDRGISEEQVKIALEPRSKVQKSHSPSL